MKKAIALSLLLLSMFLISMACNRTLSPATPAAGSSVVRAKDVPQSPTPTLPPGTLPRNVDVCFESGDANDTSGFIPENNVTNPYPFGQTLASCENPWGVSPASTFTRAVTIPTGTILQQSYCDFYYAVFGTIQIFINGTLLTSCTSSDCHSNCSVIFQEMDIPPNGFVIGPNTFTFVLNVPNQWISYDACLQLAIPPVSPTVTPTATPTLTPTISPTQTATPTVTSTPTCAGNGYRVPLIPYYHGSIPGGASEPWTNTLLDDSTKTIGKRGCFLTCLSMLAQVNPGALDLDLTAYGAIDDDGNVNQYKAAEYLGWPCAENIAWSDAELVTLLKQGYYVVAHVQSTTDAGHFVVVTGSGFDPSTQQCRFTIEDPAGNTAHTFLDQYGTPIELRSFCSNGNTTPAN
jgi:hypothetical protein